MIFRMSNQGLISFLTQIKNEREKSGEKGRAMGYSRAIESIKNVPFVITDVSQAKNLKGIGFSISNQINTYLILSKENPDKSRILSGFIKIDGVGEVTAEKWYNAGYRSVNELPNEILTRTQKISKEYYTDLIQRIPRIEIETFEEWLREEVAKSVDIPEWIIAGSYRRGAEDSGDIDILIKGCPGLEPREVLNKFQEILGIPDEMVLSKRNKKLLAITILVENGPFRRIDIEYTNEEEFPFALLYFTGSKDNNIKMRTKAASMNLDLNEKFLLNKLTGEKYPASTEEDIFKLLGMEYITPSHR